MSNMPATYKEVLEDKQWIHDLRAKAREIFCSIMNVKPNKISQADQEFLDKLVDTLVASLTPQDQPVDPWEAAYKAKAAYMAEPEGLLPTQIQVIRQTLNAHEKGAQVMQQIESLIERYHHERQSENDAGKKFMPSDLRHKPLNYKEYWTAVNERIQAVRQSYRAAINHVLDENDIDREELILALCLNSLKDNRAIAVKNICARIRTGIQARSSELIMKRCEKEG